MMFFKVFVALVASAVSVAATTGLSVKVAGLAGSLVNGVGNLKVVTTITNTGDETLKLLNDPRGVLTTTPTHAFAITNVDGSTPSFTGAQVKFVPSLVVQNNQDSSFTVLQPGQSIDVTHDLSSTYDFASSGAGAYNFEASNLFQHVTSTGDLVKVLANNEAASLKLAGLLSKKRDTYAHPISKRATFTGCNPNRKTALQEAITAAELYATDIALYTTTLIAATPRYTTWFGNYTTANVNTVKSHFNKIDSNDFESFTYDCECDTDKFPDVFAFVYPDQFGTITLCKAFWNAPMTGTDSKAGTLIHESSHFTKNGGTLDTAYGQTNCEALATSNPQSAVMNADSHEYFAENTPLLL